MPTEQNGTLYMATIEDKVYKCKETFQIDNVCGEIEYKPQTVEATVNFKSLDSIVIQIIKDKFKAAQLLKISNRTKKFRIRKKLLARITRLLA
jgi:hypothetical protein